MLVIYQELCDLVMSNIIGKYIYKIIVICYFDW